MKKLIALVSLVLLTASVAFAATASGFVTDSENGNPIEGATVRFHYLDGSCTREGGNGGNGGNGGGGNGGHGLYVFTTITDANGFYTLTDLPEGNYEARALLVHTYMPQLIEGLVIDENGITVDFALESCNGSGSAQQFKYRHQVNY